ncbi:branched-chain amino acid ABC transporter periplasmic branched-chain amino acid-binding protein [Alcanivorax balearicus MACL04]|uniref:Branched-chain amino acid ABC transporter periplasmic branched-chain amino acid-binding protein n=1 Tax=Alloalcanivorax balearicus MACL04 TaxID=1177182 RepID=A0ABT2QYF9_9GAMM|nr:substrate-binding domain-containing protein [Alloalcanivorax balearicus]MCU5782566.1 branched-chain amino acid ABC transporter periplasmic branched-chain amino acid-binding protein [Alloalcanivorax balearicus MACL04]
MKQRLLAVSAFTLGTLSFSAVAQADDSVRIAHVTGFSGPLSAYAKQLGDGMRMGFEYATDGTMEVAGRKIEIIDKDTQNDPARARSLVEEAYAEDDVSIVVGPVASGVALATLPIAEEYERIIMPEGVADAITGEDWNRYVFRVGRNSSQDAVSNAVALGQPGVCVATIAQDYAFGRDGVAAYKEAMTSAGGKVVHEEYLPLDTTDFTAAAQRLFTALKDPDGCDKGKYIFAIWAGSANPLGRIQDLHPERYDIKLATGGNILAALAGYSAFPGMEGAGFYYFESPKNEINDWFVKEHFKRFNAAPDFFTAQGFAQAMAITAALRKTEGSTDSEDLIEAMEGLSFDTPKGKMTFRPEDHQAMQAMYHFRIESQERDDWFADRTVTAGVPVLVRVISMDEMKIPLRNQR